MDLYIAPFPTKVMVRSKEVPLKSYVNDTQEPNKPKHRRKLPNIVIISHESRQDHEEIIDILF